MGLVPTQPALTMGGQAAAMPGDHSPCTSMFPVLSMALGLEPHLSEGCPLTCPCPTYERISPVLTFVLQTASLPPHVLGVGKCHVSSYRVSGATMEGQVVFVKMRDKKGGLEPTGHFIEENLEGFSPPQLRAGSCEKQLVLGRLGDAAC